MQFFKKTQFLATIAALILTMQSAQAGDLTNNRYYGSELAGLAYVSFSFGSFGSGKQSSAPVLGFSAGHKSVDPAVQFRAPTQANRNSYNDRSYLHNSLVDIRLNAETGQWSRFAFGGVNALVQDPIMRANGEEGGSSINPKLVVAGVVAAALAGAAISASDSDDDGEFIEGEEEEGEPEPEPEPQPE